MKTVVKVLAAFAAAFALFAFGVHLGVEAVYAATDLRDRRRARERTD